MDEFNEVLSGLIKFIIGALFVFLLSAIAYYIWVGAIWPALQPMLAVAWYLFLWATFLGGLAFIVFMIWRARARSAGRVEPAVALPADPNAPTADEFVAQIRARYNEHPDFLLPDVLERILRHMGYAYAHAQTRPMTAEGWQRLQDRFYEGLHAFAAEAPEQFWNLPDREAMFSEVEHYEAADGQRFLDERARQAYASLVEPLIEDRHELERLATPLYKLADLDVWEHPDPGEWDEAGYRGHENYSEFKRDWQKRRDAYEKEKKAAYAATPDLQRVFLGTPFFMAAESLVVKRVEVRRPVDIPLEARFRHQWVIGATGAGKTTFLSTMIAEDLKLVERGEASLFVMDSQNEFIPDIAHLKEFAPGGSLFGKLVYLEPDPDYPLALNIFDVNRSRMATLTRTDRMVLERSAQWMVEFFLKSLLKSESSPHQDTYLKYVIPALMAIPDATIFTLKELLEPPQRNGPAPGYEKYKQYFSHLRPDSQRWLAERMHSTELSVTRNAIRTKLDGFTADNFFHDMFANPRNKLDLFQALQEAKVILVNTNMGLLSQSGTEAFGRFFIARLVQAMEERMLLPRGSRLPVFAYIDEASDYISEEENVEELIDKARKQRMGFIFANQREAQITSPTVRDALSRVAIQCRGFSRDPHPPQWFLSLYGKEEKEIEVKNTQFGHKALHMSDLEFEAMMQEMHERYYSEPFYQEPPHADPGSSNGNDALDGDFNEVPPAPRLPPPRKGDGDSDDPTAWGTR